MPPIAVVGMNLRRRHPVRHPGYYSWKWGLATGFDGLPSEWQDAHDLDCGAVMTMVAHSQCHLRVSVDMDADRDPNLEVRVDGSPEAPKSQYTRLRYEPIDQQRAGAYWPQAVAVVELDRPFNPLRDRHDMWLVFREILPHRIEVDAAELVGLAE